MKRNRLSVSALILLVIVTATAFFPVTRNSFTNWDDPAYVTDNPVIRKISLSNLKEIFTTPYGATYLPLTMLSFAAEYRFFRLNPSVYHTTNLVLHLLNCGLVFAVVFLISANLFVSFLTALLFGIHPLHVESVAWISERKDVLYSFFFLGALVCYLRYRKSNGSRKYYWTSWSLFLLSLLAKPMAVTLPLVLFLLDYLEQRKWHKRIWAEKIPFLLLAAFFGAVAFLTQRAGGAVKEVYAFSDNMHRATFGVLFYLGKTFVPVNLSAVYPYPAEALGIPPLVVLFAPTIIFVFAMLVAYSRKYTRKVAFGSLFFLVTVLPVLQLVPFGAAKAADRYTYISLIGIFYLLAEGGWWLYQRLGLKPLKLCLSVFLVVIIALSALLTWQRCKVWKDSITLWENVLKNYPDIPLPWVYLNLGLAYAREGKYLKALHAYNSAIEKAPNYAEAYYNLGVLYEASRQYEKALYCYGLTLKFDPGHARAYDRITVIRAQR